LQQAIRIWTLCRPERGQIEDFIARAQHLEM
jgi:hypothetical protein